MNNLLLTYSAAANAADLDPGDYQTLPGNFIASGLAQVGANTMTLTFFDDVTGEPQLQYYGAAAGYQSPQTVAIT